MQPWQRFGRRRLAQSRWNCEPSAIAAADREAFEAAWQRQARVEQALIAEVAAETIPAALREGLAASLRLWLDEGGFTPPERAAIVLHHARLETAFAGIASQAPQPDPAAVQAWYLRHQAQFMRPEQRLTRHLLLTVDGDEQAVYSRIQALHGQIAASREAFAPLAQRHSHCPSALDGGRLGWIGRGLLYPQLEEALFALTENALSAPVASELGWHLVWCEAIRPAAPMTPEQALESAREYLIQQSQRRHQRQWLAEMLARQPGLCG
ncbi:TPA: nitrogen fixation protein NifM [Klebsiella quasipneumoniae subsp. quasipneumoniae]|nr:nitrogen fixation protein NifM [Klebsiella quasipneumoniae subsp. quasipneumoniae]HDG7847237.1 nitrogen fixation protein NifM [Klebsiella quasipneumoniae]